MNVNTIIHYGPRIVFLKSGIGEEVWGSGGLIGNFTYGTVRGRFTNKFKYWEVKLENLLTEYNLIIILNISNVPIDVDDNSDHIRHIVESTRFLNNNHQTYL